MSHHPLAFLSALIVFVLAGVDARAQTPVVVVDKAVDPALVGTWSSSGTGPHGSWQVQWEIQANGYFVMRGTTNDSGSFNTSQGHWQMNSTVHQGVIIDGIYQLLPDGRMQITGQDGTSYWSRVDANQSPPGSVQPPTDSAALVRQADALQSQGRYSDAILLMSQLIATNPTCEKAWFERGMCFYLMMVNRGTLAQSVKPYVGKNLDDNFDPLKGMINTAIADLTEALRLDPHDQRAWCMRGKAYTDDNQFAAALSDLNQAIVLAPDYAGAYANRAALAYGQGEDGSADLARSIELDPSGRAAYEQMTKSAQFVFQQRKMSGVLAKAMDGWNNARTQADLDAALAPWLAYGQKTDVKITFLSNITSDFNGNYVKHFVTFTFPAIRVSVRTITTLPPMIVWIPLKQSDANNIPENYRVLLKSPPGVAAWDPGNASDNMSDFKVPTGNILDVNYYNQLSKSQ